MPAPQTGATAKKPAEDPAKLFAEIESLHDRLALVIKTVNAANIRCQTETGRNKSNVEGYYGTGVMLTDGVCSTWNRDSA